MSAVAVDFFADAEPVVKAERPSQGECERNVVTAAIRATTTKPKINRRFMETSVWLEIQSGAPPNYRQRLQADVIYLTYHDLVFGGVRRFYAARRMYLTMRVKIGGMNPIVVGVALAVDHRQAQGQGFVVSRGCSLTFDGWHGSMKPEGRRTISYFSFSTFAAISGYRPIL
jgi:hypothetical protein